MNDICLLALELQPTPSQQPPVILGSRLTQTSARAKKEDRIEYLSNVAYRAAVAARLGDQTRLDSYNVVVSFQVIFKICLFFCFVFRGGVLSKVPLLDNLSTLAL